MQRYERLWERLLNLLATLGEVDPSTPGHVRVRVHGHDVELLMDEGEWEDLVCIPHGSFLGAAKEVVGALQQAEAEKLPFVVYDTYRLHPSQTPESAEAVAAAEELRRVQEHLKDNPGARGQWRPYPPGREPGGGRPASPRP